MTCKKCGAEIPEGQLTCFCFQVEADKEEQSSGIQRGYVYATLKGHLLPSRFTVGLMSYCGQVRSKATVETRVIQLTTITNGTALGSLCTACCEKVRALAGVPK